MGIFCPHWNLISSERKTPLSPVTSAIVFGLIGGAIPEVVRIIATLRLDRRPTPKEFAASGLATLLGLGALLFTTESDSPLEIAVLGASFPQLFSGLVAAATAKATNPMRGSTAAKHRRTVLDYLSWRL
jgi:hypothetical protein